MRNHEKPSERSNDINLISAKHTDELEDIPSINGPADPYATLNQREWYPQDVPLPPYEDEIDIDPRAIDPVMAELTDDPSELFQVSPLALGEELNKTAIDEGWDTERPDDDRADGYNKDDYREMIEDRDQDYFGRAA